MKTPVSKLFIPAVVVAIALFASACGSTGTAQDAQEVVEAAQEAPAETDETDESEAAVTTTASTTTAPTTTTPSTTTTVTTVPETTVPPTTAPPTTAPANEITPAEREALQTALANDTGESYAQSYSTGVAFKYPEEVSVVSERLNRYERRDDDTYDWFPTYSAASWGDGLEGTYTCSNSVEIDFTESFDQLVDAGCEQWTELEKQLGGAVRSCGSYPYLLPPGEPQPWSGGYEERQVQAHAEEFARFYADPEGIPLCRVTAFFEDLPVCRHETTINFFNYRKFPAIRVDPTIYREGSPYFVTMPYFSLDPYGYIDDGDTPYRTTATQESYENESRDYPTPIWRLNGIEATPENYENEFHKYCTLLLAAHGETYLLP